MALSQTSVLKLYHTVIDDVIAGVRDSFLDEGVDEQVLQEMKHIWTTKLMASKAVELSIEPLESQPPPVIANNPPKSKPNGTKSKKPAAQRERKNSQGSQDTNAGQAAIDAKADVDTKPIIMQSAQNKSVINQSAPPLQQTQQLIQSQTTIVDQKPPPALVPQSQPQPPSQASTAAILGLDPSKIVPIQITLPALQNSPNPEPRVLEIQVPASAIQENKLHNILTATPIIQSIMSLPTNIAASVLQQHINAALANTGHAIPTQKQVDGTADTSDDEDGSDVSDDALDNDDEDDENLHENEEEEEENIGAEEEPLCTDDDVSDEENQNELFDTDNVVVCQYDKITRSRNKWKFYLKDGIMNIGGKDYIFQKSNGDAEW